jgi:hypothetical protein
LVPIYRDSLTALLVISITSASISNSSQQKKNKKTMTDVTTLQRTNHNFPKRVWTTVITNTKYLPGLLTLAHSLKLVGSKYPLLALYTDTFPQEGHAALDRRGIPKRKIDYLLPSAHKDYSNDTRFYDCWSKLQPFGLFEYDRVVQLDSDMVVIRNMDELLEMPLNGVFAAAHACVCNPYNKPHYPANWIASNCTYSDYAKSSREYKAGLLKQSQPIESDTAEGVLLPVNDPADLARSSDFLATAAFEDDVASSPSSSSSDAVSLQTGSTATNSSVESSSAIDAYLHACGPGPTRGLGICNGGLQVVEPSHETYNQILTALSQPAATANYDFADQSLLSDVFNGSWHPLSYKYNALKTLKLIHPQVWDESEVANIHYILTPKPWDVRKCADRLSSKHDETGTFTFWFAVDDDRLEHERVQQIADGF